MIYKLHTKNAETLVNMDECILMQYAPVQPGQSGVVLICFKSGANITLDNIDIDTRKRLSEGWKKSQ